MNPGIEVIKHLNVGSTSVVPNSSYLKMDFMLEFGNSVTITKKKKKALLFSSFIVGFKCNSKDIAELIIQIDILKHFLGSFITLLTDY